MAGSGGGSFPPVPLGHAGRGQLTGPPVRNGAMRPYIRRRLGRDRVLESLVRFDAQAVFGQARGHG
jgi:hypothetical protein